MADKDTLSIIGEEIALAFSPLKNMIDTPESFQSLMKKLGWDANGIVQPIKDLTNIVQPIIDTIEAGEITLANVEKLIGQIKNLIDAIENIPSKADGAFSNITATATEFKNDFPLQLAQYLIADYLINNHAKIGSLLQLLGIIKISAVGATATRPAYFRHEIRFDQLAQLFSNPLLLLQVLYGWGSNNIDKPAVFSKLTNTLDAYNIPFRLKALEDKVLTAINGIVPTITTDKAALQLVIINEQNSNLAAGAGLNFYLLPPNGSLLPGLSVMPYANAAFATDIAITENLSFKFDTKLNMQNGIALNLRPGQAPQLINNLVGASSAGGADAKITLGLKYQKSDGKPTVVFGASNASRYEFVSASIGAAALLNTAGSKNVAIEFDLIGSKIIIKPAPGDADGFLGKLLPKDGIILAFDLGFGIGIQNGFYFKGSSALEIDLPAHLQLGPVDIHNASISIKPSAQAIPVAIGVGIKAALGPMVVIIEGIGLIGEFSFPANRKGNLGPVQFKLGFKPPKGVGLSIDAGIVKGGGFLMLDPDKGEYAGALQLSIKNTLQVSAIGIINTKMPDGTDGFSLLIIISVQFQPGISLSMGFFLSGLGGLLGINRTINVSALRDGVKNNAIENIMFPKDVVANINTLLPQIKAIFPIKKDQFIIGLMAKITWGIPSLVTIEFGIAVEFASPVRIAIMGVLKIVLPTEEAAILQLQVNFLGIIDFDKGYISFDASIYNSRILTFTLEGDMALRLNWGEEKAFLLSVGGFHPSFTPPASLNVPAMKRLTLTILSGNPNLVLTAYFAVTSNTVQFGARIDLSVEAGPFSVVGYLLFDVLFQFSPFKFVCHIAAGLAVKSGSCTLFSIDLDFLLSGPTPWNAQGSASFHILFISIKVRFNVTWGDDQQVIEPSILILQKILDEFNLDGNWTTALPANRFNLVTLAAIVPVPGEIVLQSFGSVKISQILMPLNMVIDKFGNNPSGDINKMDIANFKLGGSNQALNNFAESFAPANFKKLSDEDKLKSPSFTKEKGGVTIADTDTLYVDYTREKDVAYEIKISDFDPFPNPPPFIIDASIFKLMIRGGAVRKNALSKENRHSRQQLNNGAIAMEEEKFVLINKDTLAQHSANLFGEGSLAQATDVYNEMVKQNPSLKNKISVAPAYNLN